MYRANRSAGRICVLTILLLVGSMTGRGPCADTRDADRLPFRIERDILRFKFAGSDRVMELLAIRPGMTILDIGTGSGQFAYEFSRRLNGTGKVYATDTRAYCVDYVKKEAERRGLGNLQPVLVRKEGVDEFYGKHKYDLIAIFHVAMAYDNQVDYLRALRGSLADGGRLILIVQKSATPFAPGDFTGDFRRLVEELSLEPPEALKRAIVEDFNEALLSETRFFDTFPNGPAVGGEVELSPGERAFADFLSVSFRNRTSANRGLFARGPGTQAAGAANARNHDAILFNKLLLMRRFRKFLISDGLFASGVTPPVKAAFEKAGYRLQREYADIIPFEDLVIFSAR